MTRAGYLVTIAALAAACQMPETETEIGTHDQPLIGGDLSTDDPAVVALTRGGSASFCTGTLVSPSVVMTAAHCIDMAGSDPDVVVFFGDDTTGEGVKIGVEAKWQHLGWTGSLANDNDIGLILLSFPKKDIDPIPLNTTPATDLVGENYRVVGFGVNDQANQTADGKKRTAVVAIDEALDPPSGDEIIIRDSDTTVCFGDSGGPGFVTIDDVEYLAGIHSWTTGDNCGPPNGDTRVDLFAAGDVQAWIDDHDPTCKEDSFCAKAGCSDDPDCTPCGPDGTCVDDCPLPDPDCPTQEIGEICQADSQCMSGLCVFWRDDPKTKFCSRPCTTDDCPGGMSCQSVNPFGDICYYDEDPPGVIGSECDQATECGSYLCEDGACVTRCDLSVGQVCPPDFECATRNDTDYYCFAIDDGGGGGGCQTSGGSGAAAAFIALLGAALIRRRRHA